MSVSTVFKVWAVTGAAAVFLRHAYAYYALGGMTCALFGLIFYKLKTSVPNPPPSPPVPGSKTRICIAGYPASPPTAHSHYLADKIAKEFPDRFETWYYWDQWSLWTYLPQRFAAVTFPEHLKGHCTSPFVWFERGSKNEVEPIGGDDYFTKWAKKEFPDNKVVQDYCTQSVRVMSSDMWHDDKAPATVKA